MNAHSALLRSKEEANVRPRSALPQLPYPEKDLPENIAFIVPYPNDDDVTQFFNTDYGLIGAYSDLKKEMLSVDELEDIDPWFDQESIMAEREADAMIKPLTKAYGSHFAAYITDHLRVV